MDRLNIKKKREKKKSSNFNSKRSLCTFKFYIEHDVFYNSGKGKKHINVTQFIHRIQKRAVDNVPLS